MEMKEFRKELSILHSMCESKASILAIENIEMQFRSYISKSELVDLQDAVSLKASSHDLARFNDCYTSNAKETQTLRETIEEVRVSVAELQTKNEELTTQIDKRSKEQSLALKTQNNSIAKSLERLNLKLDEANKICLNSQKKL